MKRLSVSQREAIRHFAETPDPIPIHGGTIRALVKRGLLVYRVPGYYLTRAGVSEYHRIMSSGDGPEALKEMLRF